jgi:hypothetical protein
MSGSADRALSLLPLSGRLAGCVPGMLWTSCLMVPRNDVTMRGVRSPTCGVLIGSSGAYTEHSDDDGIQVTAGPG